MDALARGASSADLGTGPCSKVSTNTHLPNDNDTSLNGVDMCPSRAFKAPSANLNKAGGESSTGVGSGGGEGAIIPESASADAPDVAFGKDACLRRGSKWPRLRPRSPECRQDRPHQRRGDPRPGWLSLPMAVVSNRASVLALSSGVGATDNPADYMADVGFNPAHWDAPDGGRDTCPPVTPTSP